MIIGKPLLLTALLAAAFATAGNAQVQRNTMSAQPPSRTTTTDRGTMSNRVTTTDRDRQDMRDRGMRDQDMRDRDRRDMRHYGWRRGHHYGWRHCIMRWHHHHHVRICR